MKQEVVISQSKVAKLAARFNTPVTNLTRDIRHLLAHIQMAESCEQEVNQLKSVYGQDGVEDMIRCCKLFA